MFGFLCSRQLLLLKHSRSQLCFLQKNVSFSVKSYTSIVLSECKQQLEEKHSFTVSYLINSCGLSPKSAILASQRVGFENPDGPDSVLNLLRENGFTNTQISKIVKTRPVLLLSNPKNTLLPKFEFFRSIGISSSDLPRILTLSPDLLLRSLKEHLIPYHDFLKSVLLVDEKVITTLKRSQWIFSSVTDNMVPNIALLRELGVPESTISFLVTNFPSTAFMNHTRFVKAVKEVKEMGFDPSKVVFALAIKVSLWMKKTTWDFKLEIYKRWGWSKDDTLLAFKRNPNCMLVSEEKITKTMDFLVNKMGWPSADISRIPAVLLLSLEKRIIPRYSVVQILQAEGLVKNDLSLGTFLLPSEKCFLEKFVIKFQDEVPQLLNVYQGKINLHKVGTQSEK